MGTNYFIKGMESVLLMKIWRIQKRCVNIHLWLMSLQHFSFSIVPVHVPVLVVVLMRKRGGKWRTGKQRGSYLPFYAGHIHFRSSNLN